MRLTIYRHFECFGLHALLECVSSRHVHKKMIGHNIHISYLCGLHELNGCVSSNLVLLKIMYHKIHICNLCGLHEQCGCVSSNDLHEKMI